MKGSYLLGSLLVLGISLSDTIDSSADAQIGQIANNEIWGPVSGGLRCRLIPTSPSTRNESPGGAGTLRTFDRSEDITFAFELQNVSGSPISLLRTRYPSAYNPANGKITTDVLVSLLVSFELLDESGRKVNHAAEEIINDQMLGELRYIEIATLAPGNKISSLLHPARTWQWLTAGLMPGEYSALVRYHAIEELVPPAQSNADIWEGEIVSAPASFKLGDGDQRVLQELVWGPPTNNLQAALELTPYPQNLVPGTQLDQRFHVRNVGTKPIQLRSEHWRQDDRPIVFDENGKERRVGSSIQTGISILIRYILQPGQKVVLDSGALGCQSDGQVPKKSHFPVIYHLTYVPGRYTIRYALGFRGETMLASDGMTIIDIPGDDWTGTVFTGAVPLLIYR